MIAILGIPMCTLYNSPESGYLRATKGKRRTKKHLDCMNRKSVLNCVKEYLWSVEIFTVVLQRYKGIACRLLVRDEVSDIMSAD